jgi:hypothetical protein
MATPANEGLRTLYQSVSADSVGITAPCSVQKACMVSHNGQAPGALHGSMASKFDQRPS